MNSEQYRLCSEACTEISGVTEPTGAWGGLYRGENLFSSPRMRQVCRLPGKESVKVEEGESGAVCVHRTRAAKGPCALEDG